MTARGARPQLEHRYEWKRRIAACSLDAVEQLVWNHPGHLFEEYPARTVNSVYFDTLDHSNARAHIDGVGLRHKFRLRWYGPLTRLVDARLEIKRRAGRAMSKEIWALPGLQSDARGLSELVEAVRDAGTAEGFPGGALALMQPAVITRYRRSYYRTSCREVRVTLDSEMLYLRPGGPAQLPTELFRDHATILEIKFSVGKERIGGFVASRFPFPLLKHSKYLTGLLLLHHRTDLLPPDLRVAVA